jgi:putative ABC transport system permease protein
MSTATLQTTPAARRPDSGGVPARRAIIRWAVRLLRREWRQQILIFALITTAVTATFIGSAVATTTPASASGVLGSAQDAAVFSGAPGKLASGIAAVQRLFGRTNVIETQQETIPGTIETFNLQAQDPHGPFGGPLLILVGGQYPSGVGQVALTSGLASDFHLSIGGTWSFGGVSRKVTGIVENPQSLLDEFALVAPGRVTSPSQAVVLFNGHGMSASAISAVLPSGSSVYDAASLSNGNLINPETISVAAAVLGMLLIALVGVGGFSVLAQRRLRSIGMLAAQGATEGHIRLVIRANGVATGIAGAVSGNALGLIGWLLYRPTAESSSHHLIGIFQLPWTVIIASTVLAVLATYFAASRPAWAVSRMPVVAALAGRPPAPKKAGRLAPLAGIALLVISFILIGLASAAASAEAGTGSSSSFPLEEVALGLILLCVAIVLVAPACLGLVAWLGRPAPLPVRLALRDLSRYRARSGPALAAIAVATLIAVIVCVEAAARLGDPLDYVGPNLTSSQLVIYTATGPNGAYGQEAEGRSGGQGGQPSAPAPSLADQAKVADSIAKSLGNATIITLYSSNAGLARAANGRNWSGPIYLATPQLLSLFGISRSQVNPDADVLTMRPGLSTMSSMQFLNSPKGGPGGTPPGQGNQWPCPAGSCVANPPIQEASQLPSGTSAPNTVVTEHGLQALDLQSSVVAAGWFIQARGGLTAAQIRNAQQISAASGMSAEDRNSIPSLVTVVNDATVFGIVLALAILAMSVGLVRSEAAADLRTLTATGASGTTRCILVATTAGALGFTGALMGMAGGYLAAIGFAGSSSLDGLSELTSIPLENLLLILVGMPLIGGIVAWGFTLREPSAIARQPLE